MGNILNELTGQEFDFYGVDNCRFKLDNVIYEALEDENDGYRSSLGSVALYEDPLLTFLKHNDDIFFNVPLAKVTIGITDEGDMDGHEFVDDTGHTWLIVGTSHSDDWYPCFIFSYRPKEI